MDGSYLIASRSLRRVSLAVMLVDDLTGTAITGSNARAWIENGKPPIKKNDGMFVFTDLSAGEYTVSAEGGAYRRQELRIATDGERMQTITLRLRPARTYPVPKGCLRIDGIAQPGAEVTVYAPDRQSSFRLLSDAKAGSRSISVFHSERITLEGSNFRLMTQGSEGENLFVVSSKGNGGSDYELLTPLAQDHPRVGSLLVPAFVDTADDKGRFFIVLRSVPSTAKIICEARGSSCIRKEYEAGSKGYIRPELFEE